METFAFDLLEANRHYRSTPNWYREYSMAQTYSLKHFDGLEFDELIRNIDNDNNYLQTFYSYSHRQSSYANSYCDNGCKSKIMSDIMIGNPFNQNLKPLLDSVVNNQLYSNKYTKHSVNSTNGVY